MSDMDKSAPVKAGAPSGEQHDADRDADPAHGSYGKGHDPGKELDEQLEEPASGGSAGSAGQGTPSLRGVHARARGRIEVLEQQLDALEASLDNVAGNARQGARAMLELERMREHLREEIEMAKDKIVMAHERAMEDLRKDCTQMLDEAKAEVGAQMAAYFAHAKVGKSKKGSPKRATEPEEADWEDDDEDDKRSTTSTETVGHAGKNLLKINFPTTEELKVLQCTMTRKDIEKKLPEVREELELRNPVVEELLDMDDAEYEVIMALEDDEEADKMREADAFVRRFCRAILKGEGDEEAKAVALAVLAEAYDHRDEGQTWTSDADEASFIGVLSGTEDARRGTSVLKADGERRAAKGAPSSLSSGRYASHPSLTQLRTAARGVLPSGMAAVRSALHDLERVVHARHEERRQLLWLIALGHRVRPVLQQIPGHCRAPLEAAGGAVAPLGYRTALGRSVQGRAAIVPAAPSTGIPCARAVMPHAIHVASALFYQQLDTI
jgi:hypothetical protein